MNIFVVDGNPDIAANQLCLAHVTKMLLESCQLLCNAYPESTEIPCRRTHYMHPCSVWTRICTSNWDWVFTHAWVLSSRYTRVFRKEHACKRMLEFLDTHRPDLNSNRNQLTPFVSCMPEKYKSILTVTSYRNYYINEKASFAKWESLAAIPLWWPHKNLNFVRRT